MDGEDSDAVKDGNIIVDALNKFCLAQDKPKSKEDFNLWAWLLQFTNHKNFWIVLAISILFYAVLWLWNAQLRSFHHGNVELAKAIFRYFTPVTEVHGLVDSLTPYAIWSFYSGLMCVAIEFLLPSLVSWGWFFNSIPVLVFGVGYLAKDYLTDTVRQHFTTAAAFPFSVNNIVLLDGVEKKMRVVETNCKGFVRLKDCEGEEREHFVPIDRVLKSKITVIGNGGGGINAEAHNSDACFNAVTAAFTKHALYVFLMGDGTAGNPGILKVVWDSITDCLDPDSSPSQLERFVHHTNLLPLGSFLYGLHAVPFLRPVVLTKYSMALPDQPDFYYVLIVAALLLSCCYMVVEAACATKTLSAFRIWYKTRQDTEYLELQPRWDRVTKNFQKRLFKPMKEDYPYYGVCFVVEFGVLCYSFFWGVDQHILPYICITATFKIVMSIEKEQKVKSRTASGLSPSHAAIESAIVAAVAVFMAKGILATSE